jgi:hypothetical protein
MAVYDIFKLARSQVNLSKVLSARTTQPGATLRLPRLLEIPTRLEARMAYRYTASMVVPKVSSLSTLVYGDSEYEVILKTGRAKTQPCRYLRHTKADPPKSLPTSTPGIQSLKLFSND